MKIYYDTEFIEDGRTIDLISIGMVAEDGRELYLVNLDAPWKRIKRHEWLMANVVPHLPQPHGDWILQMPKRWLIDFHNPSVTSYHAIAEAVRQFVLVTPNVELWADYGAYDHVALCQLYGTMMALPKGFPMWTHDLRQEADRRGVTVIPSMGEGAVHNALADAREVKLRAEWLASQA